MIDINLLAIQLGIPLRTVCEVGVNAPDKCSLAGLYLLAERTILVEPLPWLANDLRRAFPRATVLECAVGEHSGEVTLFDRGEGSWISQVPSGGAPDEHPKHSHMQRDSFDPQFKRAVDCVTMDQIDDGQIDVLCVDVEGAEWFVIQRMLSRPKLIRLETHFIVSGYQNPHLEKIGVWMAINGYALAVQDVSDSLYIRQS